MLLCGQEAASARERGECKSAPPPDLSGDLLGEEKANKGGDFTINNSRHGFLSSIKTPSRVLSTLGSR